MKTRFLAGLSLVVVFVALIVTPKCFGAAVTLESLDPRSLGTNGPAPHPVFARGISGQPDGSGLTLTVSNLLATNGYIVQLIVSNLTAGNITGPTNFLSKFTPNTFGLGPSRIEEPDGETSVFHGTNDGQIIFGGVAPQIVWGDGSTNVLYRNGIDLIYTNGQAGDPGPSFQIVDGNGLAAILENLEPLARLSGANGVQLWDQRGAGVEFTFSTMAPNQGATDSGFDGDQTGPLREWRDVSLSGRLKAYGFGPFNFGSDFNRLAVFNDNTNIVFDAQSGGAGSPSLGFLWESNGVTIANLAANSGWDGSGTHFLSDDGTFKTAGGTGGDTIWTNFITSAVDASPMSITLSLYPSGVVAFSTNFLNGIQADDGLIFLATSEPLDIATISSQNQDIFMLGERAFFGAPSTNCANLYGFGSYVFHDSTNNLAFDVYGIGSDSFSDGLITNSFGLLGFGNHSFEGQTLDKSKNIYGIGLNSLWGNRQTLIHNSQDIYGIGTRAISLTSFEGSSDVYSLGTDTLTNSAYTSLSHVMVLGSNAQATNSNDYVFGDNAYNYFFPGASMRVEGSTSFGQTISAGRTNQVQFGPQITPAGVTNVTFKWDGQWYQVAATPIAAP